MIQFAHPWLLLLLPLVPVLVWRWLRHRHGALRFPDTAVFAGLPAGRSRVARRWGAGLRAAALVLLVLALAGPRFGDWRTRIPTEGVAVAVVLDVSGSMATPDFDWDGRPVSRLEAAKRALQLFVSGGDGPGGRHLEGRPNDLVGLVTFAQRPECPCPLTLSHAVLLLQLDAEQPRSIPGESETNLSDAVTLGLHRLKAVKVRRKVLILLSDGEHNVTRPRSEWTPRQAAQIAANLHVPVYTIDAGSDRGAEEAGPAQPDGGADAPNRAQVRASAVRALRSLASLTGGKHFPAHDTAALLAACQDIDRLEKEEIQSFQYLRYSEGYAWFGLAALALWSGLQLLEKTVWLRVP
jgi:Ca-activated chloride channel family protein